MDASSTEIRALILDMDGVLWRSEQPIGDLPRIFDRIRSKAISFILATNNATLSAERYVEKLAGFGVRVALEQIVNSSQATALFLKKKYPQGGPVFVIGEQGLLEALEEHGFSHSEQDVIAVVAGMDRTLTYEKLGKATLMIRSGAMFVGTNPDRTFPSPQGLMPGAGSILAALEAATDVSPLVIGKPQPEMYRLAIRKMGVKAEETLVIGDRLETDIAGAQKLHCKTGLVLSGVTSPEAAYAWRPAPDFIASDLASLVEKL